MSNPPNLTAIELHVRREISVAKLNTFEFEAWRIGEYVYFGLVPRTTAADLLHRIATADGIAVEWGADKVQAVISEAFKGATP